MSNDKKYYAFAAHNRIRGVTDTVLLVRLLNHDNDRKVLSRMVADPTLRERLGARAWRFASEARIAVYRGVEHRFQEPAPLCPLPLPTIQEEQQDPQKRCQAEAVRRELSNLHRLLPMQHLGRIDQATFDQIALKNTGHTECSEGMILWELALAYAEMQQFVLEYEVRPETVGVVRVEHHARMRDGSLKLLGAFNAVFVPHEVDALAGVKLRKYELPKWASSDAVAWKSHCGCPEHRPSPHAPRESAVPSMQ